MIKSPTMSSAHSNGISCRRRSFVTLTAYLKPTEQQAFVAVGVFVSGAKHRATDYIKGIETLASMRLCSNVPVQHAVQTALGGYQSINDLVKPGGRLWNNETMLTNSFHNSWCELCKA